MTTPVRLKFSHAKGFDIQTASRAFNGLPAVNVGRLSILANPFKVGVDGDASRCVELHAMLLDGHVDLTAVADPVVQRAARDAALEAIASGTWRGHNVACWCRLKDPCHGDTLLAAFNAARDA